MRRLLLPALLALAFGVQNAAAASSLAVSIKRTGFAPSTATLAYGATVTWTNADSTDHQVVANDGSFASPVLAPGRTYSFAFTRAGTFRYHDALHPTLTGTLTIGGPPPSLTLALDRPIVGYGTQVTLTGKATSIRLGSTVEIFEQQYGQPSPVELAVVQAASDGSFAFVTTPKLYTTYTASFQTAPAGVTVQSNPVVAQVAPQVVLRAGSHGYVWTQVVAGRSLWQRHVYLQRLSPFGQWVNVAALQLDRDSGRLFRVSRYLPRGVSRIRVDLSINQAGVGLLGAQSTARTVRRG